MKSENGELVSEELIQKAVRAIQMNQTKYRRNPCKYIQSQLNVSFVTARAIIDKLQECFERKEG